MIVKRVREESHPEFYTEYSVGFRDNELFAVKNRVFNDGDERGTEYTIGKNKLSCRWWEWGEQVGTCSAPTIEDKEFFTEMKKEIEEATDDDIYRLYSIIRDIVEKAIEDC